MRMKRRRIKGITLIEMVAVIVVLGISVPVLLTMWSDVAWRSSRSEAMADAMFYAQQLMEEIKSKTFDENTESPWSASLGPNGGESYPNYDDVDDFNGYSDSPATNYSRSVVVDYIRLVGTAWQACGAVASCVALYGNCANCNECCYKRIRVTVSGPQMADVTLTSVAASH